MKPATRALASLIGLSLAGAAVANQDSDQSTETMNDNYQQTTQTEDQAQNVPSTDMTPNNTATEHAGQMAQTQQHSGLEARNPEDLEGKPIFNNGEEVGDIDGIKRKVSTKERVAIIGIKGVMGANAKEVAVPLRELRFQADGESIETDLSVAELQARPDVDPLDDEFEDIEEAE